MVCIMRLFLHGSCTCTVEVISRPTRPVDFFRKGRMGKGMKEKEREGKEKEGARKG